MVEEPVMNPLLALILLGLLGQVLHVVIKLREDYKSILETPDEADDNTFWKSWKRRNLLDTILSVVIVAGLIVGQYYMWDILTMESAFFIGYTLDSVLKNFSPKKS